MAKLRHIAITVSAMEKTRRSTRVLSSKLFMNWVRSRSGQQLLAELGGYPARTDGVPPVVMGIALPPLPRVFRPTRQGP